MNRIIIYRVLIFLLAIESVKYLLTIESLKIYIINKLNLNKYKKKYNKDDDSEDKYSKNNKNNIIISLINFFLSSGKLFLIILSLILFKFFFPNNVKEISLYNNSFKNILSYINCDFKLSLCKKNTNILNQVWLTPDYLYKEYQELYSSLLYLKASNYQIIETCITKYKTINNCSNNHNIADYTFYDLSFDDFKCYLVTILTSGISTISNPSQSIIKTNATIPNPITSTNCPDEPYSLDTVNYNLDILINSIDEILHFDLNNFIIMKFPPQNTDPYTNETEKNKVYACILFIFILHSYVVPLNVKEYINFIMLNQ